MLCSALLAQEGPQQTLSPETAMWLVQRVAITTKEGITGILPGTKVVLIEDHGAKLLVSDGGQRFEVMRTQITTDAAIARSATASDYAAQNAIANNIAASISQVRQTETAEQKDRWLDQKMEEKGGSYMMQATIRQMTDEGALVDASLADKQGFVPLPEPVFVYGMGKFYVDGDSWNGKVYTVGTYAYTTAAGARKTVRAFAANKELAKKLLLKLHGDTKP